MTWQGLFAAGNALALVGWLILIVSPRSPTTVALLRYGVIAGLCLLYVGAAVGLAAGWLDPVRDAGVAPFDLASYSVEGLQRLFRSQGAVTIGWLHYLAFDLLAGLWIAHEADARRVSRLVQLPILLLTFVAGPAGVLTWLMLRLRRSQHP